jgi:hypothetical protein
VFSDTGNDVLGYTDLIDHTIAASTVVAEAVAREAGKDSSVHIGDVLDLGDLAPSGTRATVTGLTDGTEEEPQTLRIEIVNVSNALGDPREIEVPGGVGDLFTDRQVEIVFTRDESGEDTAALGDVSLTVLGDGGDAPVPLSELTARETSRTEGADPPETPDIGDEGGSYPQSVVRLRNTTEEDITLPSGIYEYEKGGHTYRATFTGAVLKAAPEDAKTYDVTVPGAMLSPALDSSVPVLVEFASSLASAWTSFLRWEPSVDYVGEDLSVEAFNDAHSLLKRYLHARLTYRYAGKTDLEVIKDEDVPPIPNGSIRLATIGYDATVQQITVVMRQGNGSVKISLNHTFWFCVNLLLLIPLRLI